MIFHVMTENKVQSLRVMPELTLMNEKTPINIYLFTIINLLYHIII